MKSNYNLNDFLYSSSNQNIFNPISNVDNIIGMADEEKRKLESDIGIIIIELCVNDNLIAYGKLVGDKILGPCILNSSNLVLATIYSLNYESKNILEFLLYELNVDRELFNYSSDTFKETNLSNLFENRDLMFNLYETLKKQ